MNKKRFFKISLLAIVILTACWGYTYNKHGTDPYSYWCYPIVQSASFSLSGPKQYLQQVEFSNDDQHLIIKSILQVVNQRGYIAGERGMFEIRDAVDQSLLQTIPVPNVSWARKPAILSNNQRWIADLVRCSAVEVWNGKTGKMRSIPGHEKALIKDPVLSPDGSTIAGVSYTNKIILWNAQTGEVKTTIELQSEQARTIAFTPDSSLLATATRERLQLFDLNTKKQTHTAVIDFPIEEHARHYTYFSFNNNCTLLTLTGLEQELKQIEVATGKTLHCLPPMFSSDTRYAISPDGRLLAYSDPKLIKVIDIANGKTIQSIQHTKPICQISFSPEGKTLAFHSDAAIHVFDISSGGAINRIKPPQDYYAFSFTPDGKALLVPDTSGSISQISTTSGQTIRKFSGDFRDSYNSSFMKNSSTPQLSADGKTLIFQGKVPVVRSWKIPRNTQNPVPLLFSNQQLPARYSPKQLAISPNNDFFAVSSKTKSLITSQPMVIQIGIFPSLEILHTLSFDTGVLDFAFSPDGKTLATQHLNYMVKIWDVSSGKSLHQFTLTDHPGRSISEEYLAQHHWLFNERDGEVVFSPDGTLVAACNKDILRVWRAKSGELLQSFFPKAFLQFKSASQDPIVLFNSDSNWDPVFLSISPDNKQIAAYDSIHRIHFLDVQTGRTLRTFDAPKHGSLMHLAFSSDRKTLAGASARGQVTLWSLPQKLSLFGR